MKLLVAAVGRPKEAFILQGVASYLERLRPFMAASLTLIPDGRIGKLDRLRRMEAEGAEILKLLGDRDQLIVLDERGRTFTSEAFSKELFSQLDSSPGRLVLLIGGPWGISPQGKERASSLWSLSSLTFPHELALLVLAEQLYRAASIRAGTGYHHP